MRFVELISRLPDVLRSGGDAPVERVSDDSRRVVAGDLFIARAGTAVRGAAFVSDALAKGAVAVISEEPLELPAGIAFAQVGNAPRALALCAHELAGNPTRGMRVIGVTGTKGKTTVAYLLRDVLRAAGHGCGMIGTVEIDDGAMVTDGEMTTPGVVELAELFARMRRNGADHCVMEVSSHALHQGRVAGIGFAVGIFTNLTGDHLDYHKTMDDYAAAKALLFEGLSPAATAVINADDAYAGRMSQACPAGVVRYGLDGGAEPQWTGTIERMTSSGMTLRVRGPGGPGAMEHTLSTRLIGRHNAYNLLAVIAAARALGVPLEVSGPVLEEAIGAPGRLQPVVPTGRAREHMTFQVFVDYAHTHDALRNVLLALRATMPAEGKLICLFGCGGDRDRTKRPKMANVAETLADRVVLTSDNPRTEDPAAIIDEVARGFSAEWQTKGAIAIEIDRRAAIRKAIALAGPRDVVLIAGKGHEDYQIIGTTKHHFDDVEEAAAALA